MRVNDRNKVTVCFRLNTAFSHFFFFFFFVKTVISYEFIILQAKIIIHARSITVYNIVYILKNIKNKSYDTIYVFKNYFVTVLLVFSFQF